MEPQQLIKTIPWENTLMDALDIKCIEATKDKIVCTMPVNEKTVQPMGLLHGGASVALAETAASFLALCNINPKTHIPVGLEINANHIKGVSSGIVTAEATPIHLGKQTMILQVEIMNEAQQLVCVSRCTVAILQKKS